MPLPWQGDRWTTTSPDGCSDGVFGIIGEDLYDLRREDVIEITEPVDYEISVSENENKWNGALVIPCDSACGGWPVHSGQTTPIGLTPDIGW